MTIQEKASKAYDHFKQDTRNDGKKFWKHDGPQWVTDLCHTAHGEMLPDDFRYKFIVEALSALADSDDPDEIELKADIYTSDLTGWLHSRNDRVCYLSEALEEFGRDLGDGFKLLAYAQYLEKREVLDAVKSFLNELEIEEAKESTK
jgi:hypothetical protein